MCFGYREMKYQAKYSFLGRFMFLLRVNFILLKAFYFNL